MLLLDVLKANSPLLAVTDGWRDVNGTKFVTVLLCWSLRLISSFICCRKRGLITGIETGGGERIMKHYVPLLISAMILGHPNVCEFLWPENWKTCSWRLFPYKRTRLLKKKKKRSRGVNHPWLLFWVHRNEIWFLYLLMYRWGNVKDVLCTIISKCNFYSKSTVGKYYPDSYSWCLCARASPKYYCEMELLVCHDLATSLLMFSLFSLLFQSPVLSVQILSEENSLWQWVFLYITE